MICMKRLCHIWGDSWHWVMPLPDDWPCGLLSAGSVNLTIKCEYDLTPNKQSKCVPLPRWKSGFWVCCRLLVYHVEYARGPWLYDNALSWHFQRLEDSSIEHRPTTATHELSPWAFLPSCCLHLVTACCAHLTNAPLPSGRIPSCWWHHHVTASCYIGDTLSSCSGFKCFSNTLRGLSSYII